MTQETAREIDLAAAQWAARMDRGDLTQNDREAFQVWLDGDNRRPGAFARVRAVAMHTLRAKALGPQFDPDTFAPDEPKDARALGVSRRGWLFGGAAMAASITGAAIVGFGVSMPQWFSTRKGEMRVVSLEDGSVISLNSATRLWVDFTQNRRLAYLLNGEALFDVAHDSRRPFVVTSGEARVRAAETSFSLRHLADAPLELLVRKGSVIFDHPGLSDAGLRVPANMRVVSSEGQRPVETPLSSDAVERELAWRAGRIAFEGETLAQAALAFERYSDTKIVVEDAAFRNEKIAGLFQANDPVGFAQAIGESLNGRVTVGDSVVYIQRRSGV